MALPLASDPNFVRVRMLLAYDGTDFMGWQKQPQTDQTFQGQLEKILTKIYDQPISVVGSGRTDRGVHALNQWAHCDLPKTRDLSKLKYRLQRMTPSALVVKRLEEAPSDFHAQISAESKTYIYRIYNQPRPNPFRDRFSWQYHKPLDVEYLQRISDLLIGSHDFACFQSKGTEVSSTIREITESRWFMKKKGLLVYQIQGSGFLKQMVRNIMATLIALHEKKASESEFLKILSSQNRQLVPAPAPAQGLFLAQVRYPKDLDNKCRKL